MNFRFLSHLARALVLVVLLGVVGVLSMGNAVWASPSESKRPPRSTVPKKEADLSITKTANPAGHDDFIFTITVTNNSTTTAAENVVIKDQLSRRFELEYVKVISGGFTCSGEQRIKCTKATLGAGQSATIEIRVDVERSNFRGSILNTAYVDSRTKDPNRKNNKSTVKVEANTRR